MLMSFIRVMTGGIQFKFMSLHCCYGDCNWLVKGSRRLWRGKRWLSSFGKFIMPFTTPHRGTDSHLEWLIKINMKHRNSGVVFYFCSFL